MQTYIDVMAGQEFYIILAGDGVGGYLWFAEKETLEELKDNFLEVKVYNINGVGGGRIKYIKMRFDEHSPPLKMLRFYKSRIWEDAKVEQREFFITVYPKVK